ncbi:MAG: hypothetical protein HC904_04470 [Blastochloris sp.]|nr:hypothetical protein [Blastochloris sp.]
MSELSKRAASSMDSLPRTDDFLAKFQQDAARLTVEINQARQAAVEAEQKVLLAEKDRQAGEAKLATVDLARKEAEAKLAVAEKSREDLTSKLQRAEKGQEDLQAKLKEAEKNAEVREAKLRELQSWQDEAIERAKSMFGKHEELIRALEESEQAEQAALQKVSHQQAVLADYEKKLSLENERHLTQLRERENVLRDLEKDLRQKEDQLKVLRAEKMR